VVSELCACGKQKTAYDETPGACSHCDHCDRACNYGTACERCKAYAAKSK
jgi:hypothetical protein